MGLNTIEIDEYRTKLFYEKENIVSQTCPCDYCQNYVYCCNSFPPELNRLFTELCINFKKANEVMEFFKDDRGNHLYASFYHIIGKAIEVIPENEPIIDLSNEMAKLEKKTIYFDITDKIFIQSNDMMSPLMQICLEISLPWVLQK